MDLSTSTILSGLVIGSIGCFLFLYGKATQKYVYLGVGLAMCIYPYFIPSAIICWLLTAVLLVPLYAYRHSL